MTSPSTTLVRVRDVQAPPLIRPRISVTIPHEQCDAEQCDSPVIADMIWHDEPRGELHLLQVCGQCMFLLRGRGYAAFFPLRCAPPLARVAALLQEEMRRRQPPRVVFQQGNYVMGGFGNFGGTGTGSYAGMSWGVRFG